MELLLPHLVFHSWSIYSALREGRDVEQWILEYHNFASMFETDPSSTPTAESIDYSNLKNAIVSFVPKSRVDSYVQSTAVAMLPIICRVGWSPTL